VRRILSNYTQVAGRA